MRILVPALRVSLKVGRVMGSGFLAPHLTKVPGPETRRKEAVTVTVWDSTRAGDRLRRHEWTLWLWRLMCRGGVAEAETSVSSQMHGFIRALC